MNISRNVNIDKFVNIRYIFLIACRAYSRLFQLAQMWKLLAPGVRLVDFLTPGQGRMPVHVFINEPAKHLHSFSLYFYLSSFGLGYNGKGVRINP